MANSIPDFDFVASFWMDTDDELLAHRGITHSILFAIIIPLVLAWAFTRWYRTKPFRYWPWVQFFAIEIFLHLFIDTFNNYGVGLFEPFSQERISFNTIYVADPFFSIWLAISFVALLILKKNRPSRKTWTRFGLGISALYLCYCIFNKVNINSAVQRAVNRQNIPHEEYFTTPTPLNNWLWFIAAGNETGFYVGYRSVFDSKIDISLTFFPRNDSLLSSIRDREDLSHLVRFSQGFYTVEKWNDTLVFNDLRFGQITGWYNPNEKFIFHYFLHDPKSNEMVVQRGRLAKWNKETVASLIRRIKGN